MIKLSVFLGNKSYHREANTESEIYIISAPHRVAILRKASFISLYVQIAIAYINVEMCLSKTLK